MDPKEEDGERRHDQDQEGRKTEETNQLEPLGAEDNKVRPAFHFKVGIKRVS